jgi:hypothetical protein
MPPERPRPNVDHVREAMRERDERADTADAPPEPPPAEDEREGSDDDASAS